MYNSCIFCQDIGLIYLPQELRYPTNSKMPWNDSIDDCIFQCYKKFMIISLLKSNMFSCIALKAIMLNTSKYLIYLLPFFNDVINNVNPKYIFASHVDIVQVIPIFDQFNHIILLRRYDTSSSREFEHQSKKILMHSFSIIMYQ